LKGTAGETVTLHLKLARVSAVLLLLLAAAPCTAPFAVCDLTDGPHSQHSATRHLTHASAVVRPTAKLVRQPIVLGAGLTSLVALPQHSADDRPPVALQPPLPARHLVLRL
jgi:hypothetical protein